MKHENLFEFLFITVDFSLLSVLVDSGYMSIWNTEMI